MKITKQQLRKIIKEEVQQLTERFGKGQVRKIDTDNLQSWRDNKKLSPITHAEEKKYNLPARVKEEGYQEVSGSPHDRQVDNGVIPIGIHNAEAYYKVQGTDNTFLTLPVMPMQMRGPRFR